MCVGIDDGVPGSDAGSGWEAHDIINIVYDALVCPHPAPGSQ